MGHSIEEPMLEAYIYETSQILENLERLLLTTEKEGVFDEDTLNEVFRSMHTVKGSSSMMMFNEISALAHKMEDIYFVIREEDKVAFDLESLIDISLEAVDYFKIELIKIRNTGKADGENNLLVDRMVNYLDDMREENSLHESLASVEEKANPKYYIGPSHELLEVSFYFSATIYFEEDGEMEAIKAYTIVHKIADLVEEVFYTPENIIDDETACQFIIDNGFNLVIKTKQTMEQIEEFLDETIFVESYVVHAIGQDAFEIFRPSIDHDSSNSDVRVPKTSKRYKEKPKVVPQHLSANSKTQSMISVNVGKLDGLMDMVGELVIAEAMVTQNPDVSALEIESFQKASRQLHKITCEMQDLVMEIRMVPLSTTFMKMHRIVRDMSKKLGKEVELKVIGEETEVDKNIIEKISDPLMHIIRNALDHGIEDVDSRIAAGKGERGTVTLEARNSGSDVLVIVRDDGKGLNKQELYHKALENGLIERPFEEMTDQEVYNLILHPGFSTKEAVTEFSGRGVGMDVVTKNIEAVGGTVVVESTENKGSAILLKIPLTLAIIEGMNIKVGASRFTIPIMNINESFRPGKDEVFEDPEGNEMIIVRGKCYPILRLHEFYDVETEVTSFENGILIMVEEDGRCCCLYADELLGQQQVVVKSLPEYLKIYKKVEGLGGCTLLGDGSISLILDVGRLKMSDIRHNYTAS